jgi:hypothetical protein
VRGNGHVVIQFDAASNPGKSNRHHATKSQDKCSQLSRSLALPLPHRLARECRLADPIFDKSRGGREAEGPKYCRASLP